MKGLGQFEILNAVHKPSATTLITDSLITRSHVGRGPVVSFQRLCHHLVNCLGSY